MVIKKLKPLEAGQMVSWTRRNGLPAKGKVVHLENATSGPWVHVDTATKGQPASISKVRPAVLTRKG